MRVIDVLAAPWAIDPARLEEITGIYSTHLRGEKIDIEALEAKMGMPLVRTEQGYEVIDGVAVIPIDGIISKKMNLFSQISGGASTQLIERDFHQAMDDPEVHSIILHADTPGGSVDGTAELGQVIFEARGTKPIYTLADGLMASAGVWIGSAADQIFMTSDTTLVGSIGVVTQHVDYSERHKQMGIKVTEIYAGKYKRIDSAYKPLSDEAHEHIQSEIDYLYSIFVDTVAKHRGTTPDDVLARMADGKIFVGQQAIDAGLVDGVATLDQLIEMLSNGAEPPKRPAGVAGQDNQPGAVDDEQGDTSATVEGIEIEIDEEQSIMKLTDLKEKHPEVAAEAHQEGFDEGRTEGLSGGATGERERIESVLAQSMPGHEALVNKLAFDGKTTGAEAAVAVLQADKAKRAATARARRDDALELDDIDASVETEELKKPTGENMTPAEKIQAEWDGDADLRAEFNDDFDSFEAYAKNRDRTKVLGGNNS